MKHITRDVHPTALRHLLDRPYGYLAFTEGGAVDAVPVVFRFAAERYYVGIAADVVRRGARAGVQVTLLIDAGWYWYDLQSIRLRGTLRAASDVSADTATALQWFEVEPRTVVAWNYGALRELESDGSY